MTRPEPKYKKVDKWVYGEVKEIELIGYFILNISNLLFSMIFLYEIKL